MNTPRKLSARFKALIILRATALHTILAFLVFIGVCIGYLGYEKEEWQAFSGTETRTMAKLIEHQTISEVPPITDVVFEFKDWNGEPRYGTGRYRKTLIGEGDEIQVVYFDDFPGNVEIDSDEFEEYRREGRGNLKYMRYGLYFALGVLLTALIKIPVITKTFRLVRHGELITAQKEPGSIGFFVYEMGSHEYGIQATSADMGTYEFHRQEYVLVNASNPHEAKLVGTLSEEIQEVLKVK